MRDMRDEGRTVLFSSHILSDVEAICDRIGIIADGRLTDCGALGTLLSPGVRAVELVATGLSRESIDRLAATHGARVVERDDGVIFTFDREDSAQDAVRAVLVEGGRLLSLSPHRDTLEALFVKRAQTGGAR